MPQFKEERLAYGSQVGGASGVKERGAKSGTTTCSAHSGYTRAGS